MLTRFHGSRATRSSLMMRASMARPDLEVGVGQLRLRFVHGRFELPVDADLDEAHQRDEVEAHAGHELVQRRRCCREILASTAASATASIA